MGDSSIGSGELARLAITAAVAAGAACAATSLYLSHGISPLSMLVGSSSSPPGAASASKSKSKKRKSKSKLKDRSSTGSQLDLAAMSTAATAPGAGGGPAAYETRRAVDEYLQFHFGAPDDILPYKDAPHTALRFPSRCADLCAKHCNSVKLAPRADPAPGLALDVGCAVGGASFELARHFGQVVGVDLSRGFVAAARLMRDRGKLHYNALREGTIIDRLEASVPERIDRARVHFREGDACDLPASLLGGGGDGDAFAEYGRHDAVLAANLLCRLPDPAAFLAACPRLVRPGGVLVLVSPYSWLEAWTPRDKWLGGFREAARGAGLEDFGGVGDAGADGVSHGDASNARRTFETIRAALTSEEGGFDLVEQSDMPFLIKEHDRKYQWGCSHATVWRRRRREKHA